MDRKCCYRRSYCSCYPVGGFQAPPGAGWFCLDPLVKPIGDEEVGGSGEYGRPADRVRMVLVQVWVFEAAIPLFVRARDNSPRCSPGRAYVVSQHNLDRG